MIEMKEEKMDFLIETVTILVITETIMVIITEMVNKETTSIIKKEILTLEIIMMVEIIEMVKNVILMNVELKEKSKI